MSILYEIVHQTLEQEPRSTEELLGECRRRGLHFKPETVELFLHLAKEVEQQKGRWIIRGQDKERRVLRALDRIFADGGVYVPLVRLHEYLGDDLSLTVEELAAMCEKKTNYKIQGKYIIRS